MNNEGIIAMIKEISFKALPFLMGAALLGGVSPIQATTIHSLVGDGVPSNAIVLVSDDTEKDPAYKFIDDMGKKAIGFLSDDSLSQDQKEKEFRKLLRDHYDMATIGRFVLGKNWKQATAAQQAEYQKLFEKLVVEIYAARFNDYKGESFEVDSTRDTGKKDVMVTSYIIPNSGSKIQVDWRVRQKGSQLKIIDVIIEGVSMSLTQRSDFSSVIQRGGGDIEVLLEHLRK